MRSTSKCAYMRVWFQNIISPCLRLIAVFFFYGEGEGAQGAEISVSESRDNTYNTAAYAQQSL